MFLVSLMNNCGFIFSEPAPVVVASSPQDSSAFPLPRSRASSTPVRPKAATLPPQHAISAKLPHSGTVTRAWTREEALKVISGFLNDNENLLKVCLYSLF